MPCHRSFQHRLPRSLPKNSCHTFKCLEDGLSQVALVRLRFGNPIPCCSGIAGNSGDDSTGQQPECEQEDVLRSTRLDEGRSIPSHPIDVLNSTCIGLHRPASVCVVTSSHQDARSLGHWRRAVGVLAGCPERAREPDFRLLSLG